MIKQSEQIDCGHFKSQQSEQMDCINRSEQPHLFHALATEVAL